MKFEYKMIVISRRPNALADYPQHVKETLNQLGDDGWEVCGVSDGVVLLKRRKRWWHVAQRVERRPVKPVAAGLSPAVPAKI